MNQKIVGEASGDRFVYPVHFSPDGHTIALAGRRNDGIGMNPGHV